ncbi:hypothetical protein H6G74_18365 [Nostoc spongiaeforme FACHB-130]|uniref:Uncharacterized protein n=1 Tax=Nostoc spongiaeforme FACHB-130 TaxID=1357510 RepID=A0ABR8FZQ0_9NOSO|nr:hypothetical protein [Nostoc spongiaeforme]MBD2596278.1 hypothetical protein [Nostoc spongiaeforme FACHB-130]
MFTRSELGLLTIPQLKVLCQRYGLKPTGNPGYKDPYLTTLLAFPTLALNQLEEGRGLKRPSFASFENIGIALDEMSELTVEQKALIKITMEGRKMEYPQRYDQERLLNLWKVRNHLSEVIDLLGLQ